MAKVYFIGAGPGDPDLIIIKGKRSIDAAPVIIYAGSLVNDAVLAGARPDARVYNSAGMTLDEVVDVMRGSVGSGLDVARVHTGDPSIYGAIREQMDRLDDFDIAYEVVPGVSSFTAAAAALMKEFTVPGISQTVICTRMEGRTPVPDREGLASLASHQASLAIFLSVHMIGEVVDELINHYPPATPVAVVQRATWPDQAIIQGTLADIAHKAAEAGIEKTALILVGKFLGEGGEESKLYDRTFSHGYRKAQE